MNSYYKLILVICTLFMTACGGGGSGVTNLPGSTGGNSVVGRVVAFPNSINANAFSSALQADGKLLMAGRAAGECAIARFNADKTPDVSFNNTGSLFTSVSTGDCQIASIAVQADGKILVLSSSKSAFTLSRYKTSGEIDTAFASQGKYTTVYAGFDIFTKGNVAIGADGGIIIYGFINSSTIGITKLRQDGTLDPTFGSAGIARVSVMNANMPRERFIIKTVKDEFLASLPDLYDFYVLKIGANASQDIAFGNYSSVSNGIRGMTKIDFDNRFDAINGIVPISSGGAYLLGISSFTNFNVTKYDLVVSKINLDGTLDMTFNGTGKAIFSNYSNGTYKGASQSDGRLIISDGTNVLRMNNDGSLDLTFKNTSNIPNLFTQRVSDILVQSDGKINVISEDFSFVRLSSLGIME